MPEPYLLSRRSAVALAATVVSSAILTACDYPAPGSPGDDVLLGKQSGSSGFAYEFIHDDSVVVVISEHPSKFKFNVTVRKNGKDVETFNGLTYKTVGAIKSDHIQAVYIAPPTG